MKKATLTKLAPRRKYASIAAKNPLIRFSFNPKSGELLTAAAVFTAAVAVKKMNELQATDVIREMYNESNILYARAMQSDIVTAYNSAETSNYKDCVQTAAKELLELTADRQNAAKNWLIDGEKNAPIRRVFSAVHKYVRSLSGVRCTEIPYIEIDEKDVDTLDYFTAAAVKTITDNTARRYYRQEYSANTLTETIDYMLLLRVCCKTDSDKKLVKLLYNGYTVAAAARVMGVSVKAAENRRADIARRAAEFAPHAARKNNYTANTAAAVTLTKNGETITADSVRAAARVIGVSDTAVHRAIKNNGKCHGYTVTKHAAAAPKVTAPRRYTTPLYYDSTAPFYTAEIIRPRRADYTAAAPIVQIMPIFHIENSTRKTAKQYAAAVFTTIYAAPITAAPLYHANVRDIVDGTKRAAAVFTAAAEKAAAEKAAAAYIAKNI